MRANSSYSIVETDERMGEQARTDPAAFTALYRHNYPKVFRYCAHRLFDRHAAEDVTSTIFLKILQKLLRFRGDGRRLVRRR